jgi:hypothetical protein
LSIKKEIVKLLEEHNYPGILSLAKSRRNVAALLISCTYDKEKVVCWRAIEAIGLLAAETAKSDPAEARNLAQRLLWMMREESGNNAWSAAEMLGEIVRNSPETFSDLAPIIASFHDEELFRRGVMRALTRIGEKRPDLVLPSASFVGKYLAAPDEVVRYYAVLLAGLLRLRALRPAIEKLLHDPAEVTVYRDGDFRVLRIGKIVKEIVILLNAEEK